MATLPWTEGAPYGFALIVSVEAPSTRRKFSFATASHVMSGCVARGDAGAHSIAMTAATSSFLMARIITPAVLWFTVNVQTCRGAAVHAVRRPSRDRSRAGAGAHPPHRDAHQHHRRDRDRRRAGRSRLAHGAADW